MAFLHHKPQQQEDVNSSTQSRPAAESMSLFPLFSNLPTELKIKIWKCYLSSPPNSIHGQHSRLYKFYPYADSRPWENPAYWTTCVNVSPAMQVCHLSRRLAWEFYMSLPLRGSSSAAMKSDEYLMMREHFCKYGYEKPGPGLDAARDTVDVVSGIDLDEVRMLVVECKYWYRIDMGSHHCYSAGRDA